MIIDLKGRSALQGAISVPGDKSITHRAVLFGALATGRSRVQTTLFGRDNLATVRIMRQLGVDISLSVPAQLAPIVEEEGLSFSLSEDEFCRIEINGAGVYGLRPPEAPLDCGNSGTTARLLTGILAAQPFRSVLMGDESLSRRPFARVTEPLSEMGATFSGQSLPLTIEGGALSGLNLISTKASAQVKSAVLLAGLLSGQPVSITEPYCSRDHTERMLRAMGVELFQRELSAGYQVQLAPQRGVELSPLQMHVPGDFSAAAFFLTAGSIFPGSTIVIRDVGFNPTRTGLYHLLRRMGAKIGVLNEHEEGGEQVVDLEVQSARLRGIEVDARDVVQAIDEIPALAVAAAFAEGETKIIGAEELRVKESDRLAMIAAMLKSFGVATEEGSGSLRIEGRGTALGAVQGRQYHDAAWYSSGDHRIAMCGALMALRIEGRAEIADYRAVETSFPGFDRCFAALSGMSPRYS